MMKLTVKKKNFSCDYCSHHWQSKNDVNMSTRAVHKVYTVEWQMQRKEPLSRKAEILAHSREIVWIFHQHSRTKKKINYNIWTGLSQIMAEIGASGIHHTTTLSNSFFTFWRCFRQSSSVVAPRRKALRYSTVCSGVQVLGSKRVFVLGQKQKEFLSLDKKSFQSY